MLALAFGGCTCGGDPNHPGGTDGGGDGGTHSDGGPSDPNATVTSLSIAPQDVVLTTDGQTPAQQAYTVTAHLSDGTTQDVSDACKYAVEDFRVGGFSGRTFSSATYGGTSTVQATLGTQHVTTGVTVKVQTAYADTSGGSIPSNPGTAFAGATTDAGVPDVVYPNSGVVLPPNLARLEFHFTKGSASNDLFQLAFSNARTDLKVYTRCRPLGGGCLYQPDANVWRWLSETNRGGTPVSLTVSGVNSAGSAPVGVSSGVQLSFAPDDVNGAIYYWSTSSLSIMRIAFALPDAGATLFANANSTGVSDAGSASASCIGCHALSRDGSKMVAVAARNFADRGQNDGRLLMLNVSDQSQFAPFGSNGSSAFESWSPDGQQFVAVFAGDGGTSAADYNLHLHSGTNGSVAQVLAGTGTAAHPADYPDWSPSGDKIVFAQVGEWSTLQNTGENALAYLQRDGGSWTGPFPLVPAATARNRYYPAVSPDGTFIVYDESTCPGGTQAPTFPNFCDGESDPSATLWAARIATPVATPVKLAAASAPGKMDGTTTDLASSFPKWGPFAGRSGSHLMWLTFSSTRRYGLRAPTGTWIWMAAVDPTKLAAGVDPSAPAFFLPYQDPSTSNHIAQWAETVVDHCQVRAGTCSSGNDCCAGLTCFQGTCQPSGTCSQTGESCSDTAPCCSGFACSTATGASCGTSQSCTCQAIIQ